MRFTRQLGKTHVALRVVVAAALLLVASMPAAAQVPQGTVEFYHVDALGSVRAVTDAQGNFVRRHDYFPFGEEFQASAGSDSRRFTAKERDAETGLDYFGARYYATSLGRFSAVDPVLNVQVAIIDPQGWNRYSYVGNRPTRFTDPDGRQWQLVRYLAAHEKELMKAVQLVTTASSIREVAAVFRDLVTGGGVSDKIDANLTSSDLSTQMEGVVGSVLQNKFGSDVVDVNRVIRNADGSARVEQDIVMSFATIEVKTGTRPVDLNQLGRLQQLGQPVVVYAPQASNAQIWT